MKFYKTNVLLVSLFQAGGWRVEEEYDYIRVGRGWWL